MSHSLDPLLDTLRLDNFERRAERLHYATGELLGADDFRAEQTYHRRQLARTLAYLHGSGTVAGLKALLRPVPDPDDPTILADLELQVQPGLAIDRLGRLIEVPRPACLRLRRWYEHVADQSADSDGYNREDLISAFHPAADSLPAAVVLDIFLHFRECENGRTPAFATGPFDALDASQPSRIRDAYELRLVPRTEADLPDPFNPWAGLNKDSELTDFYSAIFAAWEKVTPRSGGSINGNSSPSLNLDRPEAEGEYPVNYPFPNGQSALAHYDKTAVLLARLHLPATHTDAAQAPVPDWSVTSWPDTTSHLNNLVRQFVIPPAVLRILAGF